MKTDQSNLNLAFIGNSNWDIWVNKRGFLWSIPKAGITGCSTSFFGDKRHIKQLISNGYFDETPTEVGLELIAGIKSFI